MVHISFASRKSPLIYHKNISEIPIGIQTINNTKLPSYSSHIDFTSSLQHRISKSMNLHNERLETIKARLHICKNAILDRENERQRRAVLEGVRTAMNWLFGTVTSKQLSKLNIEFYKFQKHINSSQLILIYNCIQQQENALKRIDDFIL